MFDLGLYLTLPPLSRHGCAVFYVCIQMRAAALFVPTLDSAARREPSLLFLSLCPFLSWGAAAADQPECH